MTEVEFARLLQTISLDPQTGCWLKQGSLTKGYVGRFSTPEEARDAVALHRASVPP